MASISILHWLYFDSGSAEMLCAWSSWNITYILAEHCYLEWGQMLLIRRAVILLFPPPFLHGRKTQLSPMLWVRWCFWIRKGPRWPNHKLFSFSTLFPQMWLLVKELSFLLINGCWNPVPCQLQNHSSKSITGGGLHLSFQWPKPSSHSSVVQRFQGGWVALHVIWCPP